MKKNKREFNIVPDGKIKNYLIDNNLLDASKKKEVVDNYIEFNNISDIQIEITINKLLEEIKMIEVHHAKTCNSKV